MSGILALIHIDGAPVDPGLLSRMNQAMTSRGPDAQTVWSRGFVGFGHTLLRTTWEAAAESQPYTIDDRVWIVADARIDDRQATIEKLELTHSDRVLTDVELILQAYLRWDKDCVDHLLGDFAFVIWDERHQRLFCARDHFGVKPFYYSQVGNCLIISNTIDCLRQHPQVSSKLNDRTIGDLLLFDLNYDLTTTVFSDIQRLPPAHIFTWSQQRGVQTRRYWTLPVPELIRYKNTQDYLDRFQELMAQAVGDRLRTDKVASFFSGGLDSTTIAATALAVAKARSQPLDLKAFTTVYDRLMPDRERDYAGVAAASLGISIEYQVADDDKLYQDWHKCEFLMPPGNDPFQTSWRERTKEIAAHSRVALCGHGGDEALAAPSVVEMLQTMPFIDVGWDVSRSWLGLGVQPHWGSGLLGWWRRWGKPELETPQCPTWLNPDFARSIDLEQRWGEIHCQPKQQLDFPRAGAYNKSTSVLWTAHLEANDPGCSGVPLEIRLPFIDLRLLNYLLALPPVPWCVNKTLLRMAGRDSLPAEIRLRPKTPLVADPLSAMGLDSLDLSHIAKILPAIEGYVSIDRLVNTSDTIAGWEYWNYLMPISFAYWFDRYLHQLYNPPLLATGGHDTS
ncbi:asparagine synthetase B family protein [Chamaesiphon polymorphus]|uniref:asparagine synthase (glutamine-hydrolyzing) n=1 Tax=Chamaesiphon polymorphus CCALA 037 TaxID=2107692 RepID=A0A2T1GD79_9CYAN|nr:asparagine synthase-related protein [Chamaesiphon polymorphus]PSB55400.1 asparagine synthetase B [Chamaesiphon polymorphus CCALA 037]